SGPVSWKYAFERQWLFYKLWGRLLYNPKTPDSVFSNEFIWRYGKQAAPLLEASALAGQTPLQLACLFDFSWDFSLYSEGFLALKPATKSVEYISIDRQINQPAGDPGYVTIKELVNAIVNHGEFSMQQIDPEDVAGRLERGCKKALS